jgi:type IV pilus assembly protein PilN
MRLDINLASQPYEDARQFWIRWGTSVVLVAILTLALLAETAIGWVYAHKDQRTIANYKALIADRDRERSNAEAVLNKPENRTTRDRSRFLNELIERKAFSWTQVFQDLEKIMPARLHVVSIRPELDEQNQLQIKLAVAGESRDRALELVKHMEESPRFRQPRITAENQQTARGIAGDNVEFNISAQYVPELLETAPIANRTTAENRN